VIIEIVVRGIKRDGGVDLQQALGVGVGFLHPPKIHGRDTGLGLVERQLEGRMGLQVRAGHPALGQVPRCFPGEAECEGGVVVLAPRSPMFVVTDAETIGASDIEVLVALAEQIDPACRAPQRHAYPSGHGLAGEQPLEGRMKAFGKSGEPGVHAQVHSAVCGGGTRGLILAPSPGRPTRRGSRTGRPGLPRERRAASLRRAGAGSL